MNRLEATHKLRMDAEPDKPGMDAGSLDLGDAREPPRSVTPQAEGDWMSPQICPPLTRGRRETAKHPGMDAGWLERSGQDAWRPLGKVME